jgi:alpha-aminoadipate/glutamate carrier protein LysW
MATVICIECGGTVPLQGELIRGEIVQCPDCGVELEVVGLNPPVVDLAPEVEEDWGE